MPITNQQFAQALRDLASVYETDEQMQQPVKIDLYLPGASAEQFAKSARALARLGRIDKDQRQDSFCFAVRHTTKAGVVIELSIARALICKRVTKMVPTEAWECPDSLLELAAAVDKEVG